MKISKKLLNAMAVGLVLAGSMTSCSLSEDNLVAPHLDSCDATCAVDHSVASKEPAKDPFNCPPCGMG